MSRLGIGRAIRVFESAAVSVPAVIGWMRPIVLLPVSALSGLTPTQIEGILAHELAHIRRHDYLVNLAQSVVYTSVLYDMAFLIMDLLHRNLPAHANAALNAWFERLPVWASSR